MSKCLLSHRLTTVNLACVLAVLISAGTTTSPARADDNDQLRKIAAGYRANMAKFKQFSCRFKTNASTIPPDKEIPEANWSPTRWSVHGNESLYEQDCNAKELKETEKILRDPPPGRMEIAIPCSPHAYILNENFVGSYSPIIKAFNVQVRAEAGQFGWSISPFAMDIGTAAEESSLATNITSFLEGKRYAALRPGKVVDGRELVVIETGRDKDTISRRYFVDPERGHLPMMVEVLGKEGEVISRFQIVKVREFSGGWFPVSAISTSNPDSATKSHLYRRLEVTELTTDVPALSITLAANTQVSVPGKDFLFTDRNELVVNAKDLGKIYARAAARSKGGAY